MEPDYKPAVRPGASARKANIFANRKRVAIIGVVLILLAILVVAGRSLTGYVAYTASVSKELNETKAGLASCNEGLAQTNDFLNACKSESSRKDDVIAEYKTEGESLKSEVTSLKSSVDVCGASMSALNASVEACTGENTNLKAENADLKTQKDFFESNYNGLAENAAIDICCVRGLSTASWSVFNNSIFCTGNMTVTCPA